MKKEKIEIISVVPKRFEDGGWSGVPRFDWELRNVFPNMISINTSWKSRAYLKEIAASAPDTVVIAGNETSLLIPEQLRTIVVHHGCGQTHFDRDPKWRGIVARKFCRDQRKMYLKKNRTFVSLALWTGLEFVRHFDVKPATVIPSWVEPIKRKKNTRNRPRILGDWRTFNKGSGVTINTLKNMLPEYEFCQLCCTYQNRKEVYSDADCYLCLSLSEGASYSMADAEAAKLPIVTTDVGSYLEYDQSQVIPWQKRDDAQIVSQALTKALSLHRTTSFFDFWTLDRWTAAWQELLEKVIAEQRI